MLDYQRGNLHKKDWICSHCNEVVFGFKKVSCKCGQTRYNSKKYILEEGDWLCMNCKEMNFKRRNTCYKCNNKCHY
jgi:hypothetical protein